MTVMTVLPVPVNIVIIVITVTERRANGKKHHDSGEAVHSIV